MGRLPPLGGRVDVRARCADRAPPRQNNSRLDELSSKVTALRGVTVDIYDNARDQGVLDSSVSLLCAWTQSPGPPFLPISPLENFSPEPV